MIYRNARTGAVVKSDCVIQGNGWEPAESVHNHQPEAHEPDEGEMEQEAAELPVKKTSTSRRKK